MAAVAETEYSQAEGQLKALKDMARRRQAQLKVSLSPPLFSLPLPPFLPLRSFLPLPPSLAFELHVV
jgi:hypothetical protein